MERNYSEELIKGLSRHSETFGFNESKFTDFLTSFEISESSRFYEEIEESLESRQYLITFREDYKILLKMIIRNANAEKHYLSGFMEKWEITLSKIGVYNPCGVVRNLRTNKSLLGMMSSSEEKGNPFSLLADFRSYDSVNHSRGPRSHRPLLIIPGISDGERRKVYEWESENIVHEKESRRLRLVSGF